MTTVRPTARCEPDGPRPSSAIAIVLSTAASHHCQGTGSASSSVLKKATSTILGLSTGVATGTSPGTARNVATCPTKNRAAVSAGCHSPVQPGIVPPSAHNGMKQIAVTALATNVVRHSPTPNSADGFSSKIAATYPWLLA